MSSFLLASRQFPTPHAHNIGHHLPVRLRVNCGGLAIKFGDPRFSLMSVSEDSLKQFPIAVGNVPEGVRQFVVFHVPTIGRGATKCLSAVRGIYQEHTTENLRA